MHLTRHLLLALLLLLTGCGGDHAPLAPLADDAVILAFGDSLTHGTGARPEESYPAVLARLSGRRVVNAGIPGEESDAGLTRLPSLLDRHHPALVILGHGGNDMLHKRNLAATEANLRRMIALARERGAAVVLLGIPKPGIFLGAHEMYPRLAEELKVPLEEEVLAEVLSERALKSDPIHPNARGYAQVAEALAQLLKEHGALAP